MRTSKILKSYTRTQQRNAQQPIAISSFTGVLVILGFFFWSYFLLTVSQTSNCMFASNWISGWFANNSPLQLFGYAFLLALIIWGIRLVIYWREVNKIETVVQGLFIFGFFISLGFVKAMILPYGTPSIKQVSFIADIINPIPSGVYFEEIPPTPSTNPPNWPYDFPPPPSYPYWSEWFEGYSPSFYDLFKDDNSPTTIEYTQMHRCAARFQAREKDRERAMTEFYDWHKTYGWRVKPDYVYSN